MELQKTPQRARAHTHMRTHTLGLALAQLWRKRSDFLKKNENVNFYYGYVEACMEAKCML